MQPREVGFTANKDEKLELLWPPPPPSPLRRRRPDPAGHRTFRRPKRRRRRAPSGGSQKTRAPPCTQVAPRKCAAALGRIRAPVVPPGASVKPNPGSWFRFVKKVLPVSPSQRVTRRRRAQAVARCPAGIIKLGAPHALAHARRGQRFCHWSALAHQVATLPSYYLLPQAK